MPLVKHRTHKPSRLSKFLLMLPVSCALFYPLYLAQQIYIDKQQYVSPKIPESFSGFTITYLSDIHYGQLYSKEQVEKLVEKANALGSDIIILGGDYGEDSQGALDFWALNPQFKAPLGVFGVVGNHDRTTPDNRIEDLKDAMLSQGVIPLVNDVWCLKKDNASIALAGIDCFYNGYPDIEAVKRKSKDEDFVLFLPHTPDILPDLYQDTPLFFDLVLCGHTHGGQVSIFNKALHSSSRYGNRYVSGWYKENGADIFVSTGVGTSWLPVRLGAKPKIHQFTLLSSAKE